MNPRILVAALVAAGVLAAGGYGLYSMGRSAGSNDAQAQAPAAASPGGGRKVLYWHDPMVPGWTYQDHLARAAGTRLVVELLDRGGHVGFPAGARVESRTLEWLLQH